METNKQNDNWSSDPKYWKWGVFYYNKEDKRLFPPKRNEKLGFTINFANSKSVIWFIVFLILILIPVFFLLRL
ncbi:MULTISPECIES: DUF5808 domain-containing protein [unclassified Flavobacterium]|uniref:DUF5808 domain-containing protein n=1 Tax=unclassified Flavobacterium TaxID=196869 RepID=UPI000EAD41CD|nr:MULTISPECIES: DUF5808 domain-containing protein [unclassified Flavobacterium]